LTGLKSGGGTSRSGQRGWNADLQRETTIFNPKFLIVKKSFEIQS